jgi:hypothetical protein
MSKAVRATSSVSPQSAITLQLSAIPYPTLGYTSDNPASSVFRYVTLLLVIMARLDSLKGLATSPHTRYLPKKNILKIVSFSFYAMLYWER